MHFWRSPWLVANEWTRAFKWPQMFDISCLIFNLSIVTCILCWGFPYVLFHRCMLLLASAGTLIRVLLPDARV